MSQDDQFHKYGYNHYLKAPTRPNHNDDCGAIVSVRSRLMRRFQSPVMATIALVFASMFFVGIIILAYPSDEGEPRQIPIIKADLRPIKTYPEERGGMDIPYSDSTIMANVGVSGAGIIDKEDNIENLLERSANNFKDIVSKEEAINFAMSQNPDVKILRSSEVINLLEINNAPTDKALSSAESGAESGAKPDFEIKEPAVSADDVLQKIGSTSPDIINGAGDEFSQKVAFAALSIKPVIKKTTKAPNTIDFVRSVLGEQPDIASIEPAAGSSNSGGAYFVQLASITDSKRAKGEWVKMQKKYSVLASSKYRVQEAYLSGGKFYRIQAGPMSKSKANEVCGDLKAQNKSGGCLVVK